MIQVIDSDGKTAQHRTLLGLWMDRMAPLVGHSFRFSPFPFAHEQANERSGKCQKSP